MISYQRCVGEIVLNILVDEAIYSKEKNVFDYKHLMFQKHKLLQTIIFIIIYMARVIQEK